MSADLAKANILDAQLFPTHHGAPHHIFDAWRGTDPVHWNPPTPDYKPKVLRGALKKGFWVLTRYQDVVDVSADQSRFSSHDEGFVIWDLEPDELAMHQANFMGMKPADHVGMRQVLMSAFTPKMLNELTPRIQTLAREIVDDIAPRGSCEFVFDVASRLPVYTFCEMMGIPLEMREKVVELGNALADVETHGDRTADPTMELFGLAHQVAQQKLASPDGSLMSTLAHHPAIGSNMMALNMVFVVFAIAGHETTRSTAVHFMNQMLQHPDQYRLLRSDPAKHLENAIEEVLRYTSTTTNFRRTATMDTEIGGTPVKKGDKIYLSYAAANRDPAVFKDPHKFDITRENAKRHIAFGTGPHVCIGARLARIELHALLSCILERMPDFELTGQPEWLPSIWFNAITKFPIRYSAKA